MIRYDVGCIKVEGACVRMSSREVRVEIGIGIGIGIDEDRIIIEAIVNRLKKPTDEKKYVASKG